MSNNNLNYQPACNLCQESLLEVRQETGYGAVIISKVGETKEKGWFATLSPKTGGNPEEDFSIQIMPWAHLTHFSDLGKRPELAKNYGLIFAKISQAMAKIMKEEIIGFKEPSEVKGGAVSIATYGKCTTWKEKKEHLHLKVFPFRGDIGQPYTVDSSFGRKEIYKDLGDEEFIKMKPVKKKLIKEERFKYLVKRLIELLK